jgi:hypothetical protein
MYGHGGGYGYGYDYGRKPATSTTKLLGVSMNRRKVRAR